MEDTGIRSKVTTTVGATSAKGECPECGSPLELREFVDTWDKDDKPMDINKDLYCPKCDIRWHGEPGPHDFYK